MNQYEPLEGFFSSSADATAETKSLPTKDCAAVQITVWREKDDKNGTDVDDTAQETIYYGFGGNAVMPVYAGQTTDFIPVSNLNQIYVRCTNKKASQVKIYYSCFRPVNHKN